MAAQSSKKARAANAARKRRLNAKLGVRQFRIFLPEAETTSALLKSGFMSGSSEPNFELVEKGVEKVILAFIRKHAVINDGCSLGETRLRGIMQNDKMV